MAQIARTRRIGFVGFPRVTALDLVGPSEVFAAANELGATPGRRPLYEIVVLGLDGRAFAAESGMTFVPQVALAAAPPLDTVMLPGGSGLREPGPLATVARWLRKRQRGLRRIAAVCTGAWALAEAGLLDGRRATTHWRYADAFAARYPAVRVDADAIYIRDDRIYTSAGITAGIDLALALIEEDHGPDLARAVARELVVYLKRAGGQRQFSERLVAPPGDDGRLAALTAWMHDHPAADLSVGRLAERCHVSPRQLGRLFASAFAMSPAAYVERLRIDEAAQRLLADDAGIDRIAAATGFRSADVFRRAFERRFGITPTQYRSRFATRT